MSDRDVLIVGAGLAGLACAKELIDSGLSCLVLEGAERVGGRVTTDEVDGFLLDRGFQVLLSDYPEARRTLDFDALRLRPFDPGGLVRRGGREWRVVDPWRDPARGMLTLRAPFVSLADGMRMARLRGEALAGRPGGSDATALEHLRSRGFSEPLLESFFRPFFGGVMLDRELGAPAWYLLALFGWFARGSAVLPERGMRALPEQLAGGLPDGTLHLATPVASVAPDGVELESGERLSAREVVVATDASAAARLLGRPATTGWSGTTTLYYAAERSPVGAPMLVLNGDGPGAGPVNHLCVLSDAQPSYAPAGAVLVSVSVNGVPDEADEALDAAVRAQLTGWYGAAVAGWRHLRTDRIPHALPRAFTRPDAPVASEPITVCGDHVATPSIQGALGSGRRAAEHVVARLVGSGRVTTPAGSGPGG
ncbi:MAG: NAD(P)/FAD-dependent oxidoreductase [Planctomycetota bacterium]